MKDRESINHLHQRYNELSERPVTLTIGRIWLWEMWQLKGWTEADLELVLNRRKELVKLKKKWDSCLLFTNVVRDLDSFEESLSEARALSRVPKPNHQRREVLKATGRTEEPKTGFKTSSEVLASDAFKAFLSVRDSSV